MRSLEYLAAPAVFGDITTIVGTVTALCAALTAVSTVVVKLRTRRRRYRAQQLKASWNVSSEAADTGAFLSNRSAFDYEDVRLTVSCGAPGRQACQPVGLLPAESKHLWPSASVHEQIGSPQVDGESHDNQPHRVQVTFRTDAGYWHLGDKGVERVRSLVIWAERNRAETLRRYFGHRSAFRKGYSVAVTVEPFERTEELEHAFTHLAATGEPLRGFQVPDVVAGPHDWIGRVARERSVEPPLLDPAKLPEISPVARAALSRNGRMYAIPYVFDSVALIRNDALAGGPMPATFGDVVSAGVALQVGAPDDTGNAGDPYHMWPLFSSLGGSFFGLGDKRFEDIARWRESFVDAFVRLGKLGLDPRVGRAEALESFLEGKVPYLVCSSRALRAIKEKRLDVTVGAVPPAGERPARPLVSVYGLFIYENAPNLSAARELVASYLASPKAGQELNRYQQLVPVQEEAMSTVAEADPVLRPYVEQCRAGMVMPSYPEMREAWQLIGRTEYQILSGTGDAPEVASKAADEGWELLREAREAQAG
ncbi:extracellular solute-binding protein [Amycolatopsis sp. K13G38]|uniref:Extracellular solute-binding protein n=1 Tax=Amycolatopsis acididurans TaxID=2724524 RepID=A0ABX1JFU8_9PSEU|nr:extracellular solute-binding protein [Amycolatopsis acididurans]NKQ58076.1 extracellular solute-binding protein [Amycolatopsis acididurans]